jgi:tRNA threonylcarbamoyl adenosine modification protein (Sua5/YciO/YrdC/YwlC family)
MLLKIHPKNPNIREIAWVVECLRDGGVVICPTDTVYGFTCDMTKPKAVERIARLKGIAVEKANFSFICSDLRHLADHCKPIDNPVYKLMRKVLPGPFTFILEANNNVPKIFKSRKKTVGIRVPDNNIAHSIVMELGNPLLNASVHNEDDEILEYITDPEVIHEKFSKLVDIVIDGGPSNTEGSTIIDCTDNVPVITRQGLGLVEL